MRNTRQMRSKRSRRALVIMALTVAACRSPAPNLPAPTQAVVLRMQATESTIQLARALTREYAASRPDQRILAHISEVSYADALASTPEDGAYTLLGSLPPDSPLWAAPVGRDRLTIIAHPASGTSQLAPGDLQALFAGHVTTWAAVGGADLPVTVVSREPTSAGYMHFVQALLAPYPLSPDARLAASYEAVQRIVASTPGAVGYVPSSTLPVNVTPLSLTPAETAALETTLYVVGPAEPTGTLRDFIAWIQSPPGQAIVSQTHQPIFPG